MKTRILAFAAALVLAGAGFGWAQGTTGSITGRVVDAQGLALPGASVTVAGPQGSRTVTADADGRFSATLLVPGSYTVTAELQDFKTAEAKNVQVLLGQTVPVNLRMEVGEMAETVEVLGASTQINTGSTTTGAVLTSDMLTRLPVGRRVTDALYLAPGVSTTGVGAANPSFSGGSGLDNLYVIDGVNVSNTGYGAVGSYSIVFGSLGTGIPFDFAKEIQVKTGGYEAEFGQSMGGIMNVVTKSGTNQLRGSVFGNTQPGGLEAEFKQVQTINGAVNTTETETHDVGFEAGFPVIQDRLFAFGALGHAWERRDFIAPQNDPDAFPLAAIGPVTRERNLLTYAAKATWQMTGAHRLDASFFGDPSDGPTGPQRATSLIRTNTAGYSAIEYGGHNQTLRYDGVLSTNWFVEAAFARAKNKVDEIPSVDEWAVSDFTVTPNITTGGIGFYEAASRGENQQWSVKSTNTFGGHQVKYGFLYEDIDYRQANNRTGPTFNTPSGQTATGGSVSILPEPTFGRIYRVNRANFNIERPTTQSYWAVFLQDSWRATDRLTINAGLRYEEQELKGTFEELTVFGTGATLENFPMKDNWAPRIGVTYDVVGSGRSKLFANYGRFYARVPNDLAARALSADAGLTRSDYFDANLTQMIPAGVQTCTPSCTTTHYVEAGVHPSQIEDGVKLSFKDEFVGGFEWEAYANTNVGVRYIYRTIGRVLEDVAQFPLVGYFIGHPDAGSVEYIMTNPSPDFPTLAPELGASFEDPEHTYNAVEFTFDRRFSNNWQMNASYRWSRLHGTFEGFFREDNGQSDPGLTSLYDFPTNDPSFTGIGGPDFGFRGDIRYLGSLGAGPLPLDRPHWINVSGNYTFDNGLALGAWMRVNSGKPLTALASNPAYDNGGEIPEGPRGSGIQTVDGFRTRTPWESQVNLQASYSINLGERRLTLMADAFNLFNSRTTLDYDNYTEQFFDVDNPDYGTQIFPGTVSPAFQAPFRLRVGARFTF
jgi:hypothetical protein